MRLHHFTSARQLNGIARHGLTVGDVPTNIFMGWMMIGTSEFERTSRRIVWKNSNFSVDHNSEDRRQARRKAP